MPADDAVHLIEKLERATGPAFFLDDAIWSVIHPDAVRSMIPPAFTGIIDKALLLLPEGWQWQVSNRAPAPHAGRAYINNRELHFVGTAAAPNPALRQHEATAATPAIALCIVCLRERATLSTPTEGEEPSSG